jgi:hypothetical protein
MPLGGGREGFLFTRQLPLAKAEGNFTCSTPLDGLDGLWPRRLLLDAGKVARPSPLPLLTSRSHLALARPDFLHAAHVGVVWMGWMSRDVCGAVIGVVFLEHE